VTAAVATRTSAVAAEQGWYRDSALFAATAFLALSWLIPQRLGIGPLGQLGSPATLLGVVLFGWWGYTRIVPSLTVRGAQPVRWFVALDLVVTTLLAGVAFRYPMSAIGANGVLAAVFGSAAAAGVMLVIADGIRSLESLERLVRRAVVLASFISLLGIVQWFTGYDFARNLNPPGLSFSIEPEELNLRSGFTRVQSTANHPIELAVVMAMVLPLAIHVALFSSTTRTRIFWWLAVAVIGFIVPLSVSRSGVVAGLVVSVGVLIPLGARARANLLAAGTVALGVVMAVAPGVLGTLRALFANVDKDPSIEGRTSDYDAIAELIEDRLWFGLGPGTFNPVDYFILDNQYLATLVANGILGLAVLIVALVVPFCFSVFLSRRCSSLMARHLLHSIAVIIATAIVTSALFDSYAFSLFASLMTVTVGMLGALWRLRSRDDLGTVGAERAHIMSRRWRQRWPLPADADLHRRSADVAVGVER
jgi:hypothetical protein